jgi:hypothetical protein
MAYTIVKSDGTILTTIADGTINTTSTPFGLPGRNFAGYGQAVDTNFVHQLENFADSSPPPNPLRGQLWYNTNNSTMYVCPADGETNAANWFALALTSSGGTTTFGSVTVQGSLQANTVTAISSVTSAEGIFTNLAISGIANINGANISSLSVGTLTTTAITTGSSATPGTLTGTWTVTGTAGGNSVIVNGGNLYAAVGIKVDPNALYDLSGNPITFSGTYSNANVTAFLPTYSGTVGNADASTTFRGNTLTTGANTTAGSITGNWTLTPGSILIGTAADLAEYYEADAVYKPGTVLAFGGDKEVTIAEDETPRVAGVVSTNPAYAMNANCKGISTAVALQGRVPTKVCGTIHKGDMMVSAGNGFAKSSSLPQMGTVIGKALENFDGIEGIIEISVGRL